MDKRWHPPCSRMAPAPGVPTLKPWMSFDTVLLARLWLNTRRSASYKRTDPAATTSGWKGDRRHGMASPTATFPGPRSLGVRRKHAVYASSKLTYLIDLQELDLKLVPYQGLHVVGGDGLCAPKSVQGK